MSNNRQSMDAAVKEAQDLINQGLVRYSPSDVFSEKLGTVLSLDDFKALENPEKAQSTLASIFKSYDIRGVVIPYKDKEGNEIPLSLSRNIARRIGRALGSISFQDLPGEVKGLNPGDAFVVGRDNGLTSPALLEGLAEGLMQAGINVVDVGEGSTGAVYGAIQRLNCRGGAMITRSHVEKEYNGMKIVLGREALHSRFIEDIRDAVFSGEARAVKRPAGRINGLNHICTSIYEAALKKEFSEALLQGDSPVAINFGGGTARLYQQCLKELLGRRLVKVFREESDPEALEGLPDPTQPRYLNKQIAWSRQNPDVTLFSFDLDADRVSVMIGGDLYLGDVMAFPLAAYNLEQEWPALVRKLRKMGQDLDWEGVNRIASTVLSDPRCSKQLYQIVEAAGGRVKQNRIGHSHFKATINRLMDELSLCAGFGSTPEFVGKTGYVMWQAEYSLHFFGTDEQGVPADDAIRFMLKFITIMDYFAGKWNRPRLNLKEYLDHLYAQGMIKAFVQSPEIRTVYDNEDKSRVVSDMEKAMGRKVSERGWVLTSMNDLGDGFRIDTPQGFILFRYSNTSPKLTMRIEAASRELWMDYFKLLFSEYNRLKKPEYTLDMTENAFLKEQFGIADPESIR
jgi:phosphomannomutase/phosphoglucomutase